MLHYWLKDKAERSFFGVFAYLGEKFGIQSSKMRLYFIYLSFLTLGSPVVLYLIALFWLNVKKYLRKSYIMIFD